LAQSSEWGARSAQVATRTARGVVVFGLSDIEIMAVLEK
jgi:hypothetical protein